jgi:hypothetical protein
MNTDWQDCVLSDSTNCGSYKNEKETCAFSTRCTFKDDVSSQLKKLHATKITEPELKQNRIGSKYSDAEKIFPKNILKDSESIDEVLHHVSKSKTGNFIYMLFFCIQSVEKFFSNSGRVSDVTTARHM